MEMRANANKSAKRIAYMARALLLFVFLTGSQKLMAQISSATINVNGAIAAPTGATSSTGSFSVCSGTLLTLTPTGGDTGADGVYKWYSGSCGGTLIGTGPTYSYTFTSNIVIYVRVESPVCGNSTCYSINLTVSQPPTVTGTLSNVGGCYGTNESAVALTGTPSGVVFDISGGADAGIPDTMNVTSVPAFTFANSTNDAITKTITVTPKANGCSGTPATFTATVFPQITLAVVDSIKACNGESVVVPAFATSVDSVTPLGISGYTWSNSLTTIGLGATGMGDIASFTGTNTDSITMVATITVVPTYTISATTCAGPSESFAVSINPTPNGNITIDPTICAGTSAPLIFNATNGTSYGPWTLGIAEGNIANTPTSYPAVTNGGVVLSANPVATTTYYLMSITDSNGCSNP